MYNQLRTERPCQEKVPRPVQQEQCDFCQEIGFSEQAEFIGHVFNTSQHSSFLNSILRDHARSGTAKEGKGGWDLLPRKKPCLDLYTYV